ncbi:MAG: PSD1 and planctomycete cytochrome C domain-containing protein [Pirellulales bacterium]|nr:PSD1 and planctomycete cytochrome C domain-containing protein [Pirellulales bacterium]
MTHSSFSKIWICVSLCLLIIRPIQAENPVPETKLGDTKLDETRLPPPSKGFDFHKDIRPILESSCLACHGATKQNGAFRLDTREHLLKGGDNGIALHLGKSAASPLIARVARLDKETAMPPKDEYALKPEQISLLRAWIDAGLPWPEGFVIRGEVTAEIELEPEQLAKLPPAANRQIDFIKDVQPIFAENCFSCHGPHRQEAGFRLDHKPTVLAGGELGVALAPGKSDKSLLIHFVAGLRPEGTMPKKGAPLTAEQIGILRAWIDQGADYPDSASVVLKNALDHWAFKAPVRPPVPQNGHPHPIDAFVSEKHGTADLRFSPPAEKAQLLRRVHLDLIGLPPTVAELDAFLADNSPDAFIKVVDKLLASPHYGERWARHWLDASRYADSDGYEKDKPRIAHFYRDWVINAYNRDLPYNQFIIEQLAGDLLPNATQDQHVATGFLRNSMLNEEGGVDPEQFRMEAMFDRMDAMGKAMLGIGLNCAQCHTHKYDPIQHEEYYRLFAYLNNDHEAQPRVYAADELMQRASVLQQIGEIEKHLQELDPAWAYKMAVWEDSWRAVSRPAWTVVTPDIDKNSTGGQRYYLLPDGSFLAQGYQPTKSTAHMTFQTDLQGITAFQLETLHDDNLPARGPGRSFMGTFGLSEFKVEAKKEDGGREGVKVASAAADLQAQPETAVHPNFNEDPPVKRFFGPASYALDGNSDTGWSSDLGPGRRNFESTIVFNLEKPLTSKEIYVQLMQNIGGWNSDDLQAAQLGRFRLSVTTAPNATVDPVPPHVRRALAVPRDQRNPAQVATIFAYWRTTVPEWKEHNDRIEALWATHPEGTTQMTLAQRDDPRLTSILKRGDWLKPGKAVTAGVPKFLHQVPPDAPPTRLTLAHWVADRNSPTTARVFVNRVWQAYFGVGIVSTSEDFGTQSEAPSHQELLDWLAVEFMDNGWSVKQLHKLIVTSQTYQQSSAVTPEQLEKDPYNRLLARGPRFRVEGEIVRDIQLATSGLLNPKLGGRAVMPPAPAFLFVAPASYAPFPWKEETGEDRYRRAVYTWRRRTTPYPFLQTFDTPDANVACVRRTRANTPLQALMTLNETVSMEAARALARRILQSGGPTDLDRINFAFRTVLSRSPSDKEIAAILQLLEKQEARIAAGWVNPWEIATGKKEFPTDLPKDTNPTQLAAYTIASRVLLNLDETVTKE